MWKNNEMEGLPINSLSYEKLEGTNYPKDYWYLVLEKEIFENLLKTLCFVMVLTIPTDLMEKDNFILTFSSIMLLKQDSFDNNQQKLYCLGFRKINY